MRRSGSVTALVLGLAGVLLLALPPGTTRAQWYDRKPMITGSATVGSGRLDLVTPGAAGSGRAADWSTTQLTVPAAGGTVYAAVTTPAPVLSNTGISRLRFGVTTVSTVAGGAATTETGGKALAATLGMRIAVITSGGTCSAATFSAGTLISQATISPIGAPSGAGTVNPLTTASPIFAPATGPTIDAGTTSTLCVQYSTTGAGTGTWGRTLKITITLLGTNTPGGTWSTQPVTWTHVVRMVVPPPVAQSGAGAADKCVVTNAGLGLFSTINLAWAWPTPSGFGGTIEAATRFDLYLNGSTTTVTRTAAGTARSMAFQLGLLGDALGFTATLTLVAVSADGSSDRTFTVTVTAPLLGLGNPSCA